MRKSTMIILQTIMYVRSTLYMLLVIIPLCYKSSINLNVLTSAKSTCALEGGDSWGYIEEIGAEIKGMLKDHVYQLRLSKLSPNI